MEDGNRTRRMWLGHQMTDAMIEGAVMVVSDMVINALKERETLLNKTHNLVLGNICASNLVSSVLVKSVSIVHHGYAVAARVTQSNIAFCMVYTMGYRTTWAVLPWSLTLLSWVGTQHRIRHIKVRYTHHGIRHIKVRYT